MCFQPGRVVTLVEDEKSRTYGLVFKVTGRRNVFDALEHLYEREIENGYTFQVVNVECVETGRVHQALTCIAFEQNAFFLGPPPISEDVDVCQELRVQRRMAIEIATACGKAGPNYEYLLKLADYMRKLFPHDVDEHLYQLETHVIAYLKENGRALQRA